MTRIDIGELVEPSTNWLGLNESSMLAGVVSSDYEPALLPGEQVRERMDIHLRGGPEVIRAAIRKLEALAEQANRYEALRIGNPVFLRLLTSEADGFWYARVFRASLSGQAGWFTSHELGAISLGLAFERENHFESDPITLPLSNSGGGMAGGALAVVNHSDETPGHDNYVDINATQFVSDLPARMSVRLTNNGARLGDVWAGVMAWPEGSPAGMLCFQAESAAPGTVTSNSSASGGKVLTLSWSGSGWTALTSWAIGSDQLRQFDRQPFMPILRWPGGMGEGATQFRLAVSLDGAVIYESAPVSVPPGAGWTALPPMRLPLGRTPMLLPLAPYALTLWAQRAGGGAHSLILDDLIFQPQTSAVVWRSISGLANGAALTDDSSTGYSATSANYLESHSHQRLGGALEVAPGKISRLNFFMTTPDGMAPIDLCLSVAVKVRKRRRIL